MMHRRGFLFGLGASLIVAPSIVHASNLMPVKPYTFQFPRNRLITAELIDASKGVRWKDANGNYVEWIDSSNTWAYGDPKSEAYVEYNDLIMNYDPIDNRVQAPGYTSRSEIKICIPRVGSFREFDWYDDDTMYSKHFPVMDILQD